MRLRVRVFGALGEAWGAVSMCVRGELPAFHLSVRDECEFQSRGSVVVELGRKASLKATRNLRLSFWGSKNILHMVVKSSLLFFPLKIGTFSVILCKSFRSNFMGFGAGTAFGNMGVSVHRAEVPIKKFKNISNCPNQGSFKCSFHKCFTIWLTVCCFCGHLCLCLGKKGENKKKEDKNNQPPQPVVDSNAEEPQTAAERLWPAVQRATLQHGSTKPGLTLQYQALHPRARAQPPGEAQPSPTSAAPVSRVCGKLSTNLPAVLHYLNVSKSSTFNVYKYILLQKKFKNCGLQAYN